MNCLCNPQKFHQEWATTWSSWNWPLKIVFFVAKSWRPKNTSQSADNDDELHLSKCKPETSPPNHSIHMLLSLEEICWKGGRVGPTQGCECQLVSIEAWVAHHHHQRHPQSDSAQASRPTKDSHRSQQAHQIQHHASQQDHQLYQEESGIEVMDLRGSEVLPQYKLWSDPASKRFFITGNQTHLLSCSHPDKSLCKRKLWRNPATVNQMWTTK